MTTLKEAAWVTRATSREKKTKKKDDHPSIFNKSILFNLRIKFIYKNKINKKQQIKRLERTHSRKKHKG